MTDSGADASPRSPRPLRVIIFIGGLLSVGFVIFWALHQPPEDHHRLALLALRNRQEDAAVREFMMHLRQHPDDIRCKRQVASLIGKSDPELAIRLLKEIPESDPQYVDAARELVAICLQSQQLDEAVAVLNRLTRFDATQLGAQLSLAELYFRDRKFQESLLHAQRALELAPDRVETLIFLADVHDELLQPERMVEPLRHALTIDPESYTAHLNLAYALHRIGQIDAAAPHAEWCLERNPDEIAALRILASVSRSRGQLDQALAYVSKALAVNPVDVDARMFEAELLLFEKKGDHAYQRLSEIYEANCGLVRYMGLLTRCATAAGRRDEAKRLHEELAKLLQQE